MLIGTQDIAYAMRKRGSLQQMTENEKQHLWKTLTQYLADVDKPVVNWFLHYPKSFEEGNGLTYTDVIGTAEEENIPDKCINIGKRERTYYVLLDGRIFSLNESHPPSLYEFAKSAC
ncbi:hypothetical protein DdX_15118 [Ditylenchus destructor]|uniref:Uncharacterized protein n=1 Tax=Ditylenchus destructor TaxID=166010 RepID=A0AAD4MS17_9BILA|nr:hypothetical protein DdX_15118 [Ditylenchus destructor]